jgi:two-component system NtrC family sensor kinase
VRRAEPGGALAGERVLVVDDSADVREVLRTEVLGPGGYEVLTAVDGADGLRLALQERPDLVILDARMPGMGGVEFLRAFREEGLAIPIILCAVRGSEDLLVQALRLGVRDCVVKPFEPQEMRLAVERVLAEARLGADRDRLTAQLGEANERLQRQLQELQTLYGLGRSVTSLLDLDAVLGRVVEAAVLVTQAEEGLLLLRELPTGDLVLRAARDIDEGLARRLRIPIDDTLAGQVVRTGEQVVIAQARSKLATGYLVNALIYVPLRTAEAGIIGVLGVANRRSDRSFSEHEVQVLSALADYASVAVQNARLYERAETERRKLEAVLRETAEAVVVFDFDTGIELANPTACEALQLPSDATAAAAEVGELHPSVRELLDAVTRSGRVMRTEVLIGGGRTFSAQVSPVEGVGYVLMMQDVTHLKELDRVKSTYALL